jgi:cysteine desulfurase
VSDAIYLDYQSTTPLAPEARVAMEPFLLEKFSNPHSSHRLGREAKAIVELSREQLAESLGVRGGSLWFTAGATEAANWAIKGMMAKAESKRNRIVTIASEHACVIHSARYCHAQGYPLTILGVGSDGRVDLGEVADALGDDVALVAVMLVNNEIGVVQPIAEIGALAHAAGALMVCDAVQGFGRVDLPWEACDMIALSSHKVHGPKGIGALWHTDNAQPCS